MWNHPEKDLKIIVLKTDSWRNKQVMHQLSLTHLAPNWQAYGCCAFPYAHGTWLGQSWYLSQGKQRICDEQPRASCQLEIYRKHDLHPDPLSVVDIGEMLSTPLAPPEIRKDVPTELVIIMAIFRVPPFASEMAHLLPCGTQSTEWAGGILIIMTLQERTDKKRIRKSPREWIRFLKFTESSLFLASGWVQRGRCGQSLPWPVT